MDRNLGNVLRKISLKHPLFNKSIRVIFFKKRLELLFKRKFY